MRINGFSGMNIDSMVKDMITAKKVPLDQLNQKVTTLQWQRDSYREMNSKLYDFKTNKIADKYNKSDAMNPVKAVVTGNTTAIKAEATATANGVPMEVVVTQLATSATVNTNGVGQGYTTSMTLGAVLAKSKVGATIPDGFTLQINGKDFNFKSSKEISSIIAEINSDSKANATATFDEITGKFSISSKSVGKSGELKLAPVPDPVPAPVPPLIRLPLLDLFGGPTLVAPSEAVAGSTDVKAGKDAEVTVNGAVAGVLKGNTLLINGVTITLLAKTDGTAANITTKSDPEKVLETVKSFISDYNNLIKLMNSKVEEEKYRKFPPLTAEQRSAMNEDDIKTWEEKAKSGLLKNDDILKTALSSLRATITDKLGDLSSYGITGGKYYENGKLQLDESKFKLAVEANPQRLLNAFQGTPGGSYKDGIYRKMSDTVDTALDKLVQRAGTHKFSADTTTMFNEESVMGRTLKDYNTRISAMKIRIDKMETQYYKQFTAMETSMNKYNSQSSSLSSFSK